MTTEYLSAQYRRRFEEEDAGRRATWRVLVDAWFQRYVSGTTSVLDLGCGWGTFINSIDVENRYAMDLNPDAKLHLDPDVVLFVQPTSRRWPIDDSALDLVFTSNFLEHLPDRDAIKATLDEAFRTLRPGGRLVCLGPNVRYAPGAYWDFFDHLVPLSERSLAEAIELSGFDTEETIGRFLPWTMAGKPKPPAWGVRLYLRLRPVWRIFGRQFLVVARKPA